MLWVLLGEPNYTQSHRKDYCFSINKNFVWLFLQPSICDQDGQALLFSGFSYRTKDNLLECHPPPLLQPQALREAFRPPDQSGLPTQSEPPTL